MAIFDLSGRVALVTGSSRGIGRATALLLAQAGADVAVTYRSDEPAGRAVVERIIAQGRRGRMFRCDVADTADVASTVQAVEQELGRLDILVSNAGAGTPLPATEATDEEYKRVFDINVRGFLAAARAALPGMLSRDHGRIVAISSVTGKTGKAFLSPSPVYAAAKAAIVGMVRGLAREAASKGVTVNAVRPGWIDTDATARASADVRVEAIRQIPVGRTGQPDDVAAAVLYLTSNEASYVTGVSLDVNGGLFIG